MDKKGNNKRFAIAGIAVLVLIIIVIFAVNMSSEKRATRKLTKYGEKFYSYYYEDNSDEKDKTKVTKFISQYSDTGIKVSLKNLREYMDTKKIEDYSLFNSCDQDNTKVVIHPFSPYGKKDRTVEVILDCKFSKK